MATSSPPADHVFAPPGAPWRGISPRWATLHRLGTLLWLVPFAAVAVAAWLLTDDWRWAIPPTIAGLAVLAWRWWAMGRLCRAWGYAELADDLWVTHGLMFKRLTAVPYGRMQVVEVEAGPVERLFHLATVKLVTASASTDAVIPGLPPEDAAALRDRLTELSETRTSGL